MPKELRVSGFSEVGASEGGEHVVLGCDIEGGDPCRLLIPASIYQALMAALLAAGSLTYQEQPKRLGTPEAVMNAYGVADFKPSSFHV
jgi:hypothetical protein